MGIVDLVDGRKQESPLAGEFCTILARRGSLYSGKGIGKGLPADLSPEVSQ